MTFDGFLISDGATGTELIKLGVLKKGISPEHILLDNPSAYTKIHRSYYDAGSDYVVAGTFGCTRTKLAEWGLENKIEEINRTAIRCVKEAIKQSGRKGLFCAASIGPTGRLLAPLGGATTEELIELFKEQIKIILDEGVDFFVIETMCDLREAKAAYVAIRDLSALPVGVCLTFDANQRTMLNNTPQAFAVSFDSTDVSFIGINCSVGPKSVTPILKGIAEYTSKPLIVNPNAGVGSEHFSVEDFTSSIDEWISLGARIFGGCCGTDPEYISAIKKALKNKKPVKKIKQKAGTLVSSGSVVVNIGLGEPLVTIGERINPTNRKKMSEELKNGNFDSVLESARLQVKDGANILDVNMGIAQADQVELIKRSFALLCSSFDVPLCVDSTDELVIETALRNYGGKLLINSTTADKNNSERIFKLAKRYGACVVGLTMDENGIPDRAEDRLKLAKKLLKTAKDSGLDEHALIIDPLTLSLASNKDIALETIRTIELVKQELKLPTVIGLSNISFGMPERDKINQAFLALALKAGLSMVIMNPSLNLVKSNDVLTTFDVKKTSRPTTVTDPVELLKLAVIDGDEFLALEAVNKAIENGVKLLDIVNNGLISGMNSVGLDFKAGKCFLPQVVLASQVVKKIFEFLKPKMGDSDKGKKPTVLMATVKGDIHDIGKNIVITLLETNGFNVHDLGKSVPTNEIIENAKHFKPQAIGLSSLMTTTMEEMDLVVRELKKNGLKIPVVVGGAVVTSDFADKIGAIYAKDAIDGLDKFKSI